MSSDLSSLLASSKALTSHLKRQDLPNVSLSLDQIEAHSRRLLPRQAGAQADTGRACVSDWGFRTNTDALLAITSWLKHTLTFRLSHIRSHTSILLQLSCRPNHSKILTYQAI